MTSTRNGVGAYRRTKSPNGRGPSPEQMARIEAAQRQIRERREIEQTLNNWHDPVLAAPATQAPARPVVSGFDPDAEGGAL